MQIKPRTIKYSFFFLALLLMSTGFSWSQNKKIDSLLVELNKEKSEIAKIPILRQLSIAFTSVNVDKKFMYANQYRIIAEKNHIDSLVPMAYLDMGIKYGIKTQYDSAMYYFTKALKIAKEKKISSQEARAYVSIGYVFDRLDNPKASIENYKSALEIFKKINHKKGLNQSYINLGALYYDLKEYKIADAYFRQALKISEQANDKSAIAQGYFNIGGTNYKLGNNEKAYEYYMKSLKMREKMDDLNGIALAEWGLGELFTKQGKYKEAQESFDIALKNNRIIQNKYQESAVLLSIGRNDLALKKYKEAEKNAREALENAKLMTSKGIQVLSLELLIDIATESKNYKKAYDYQSEIIIARDSLNVEKIKNDLVYTDFKRIRDQNSTLEKSNEVISTKNLSYKRAIYIISSLLIIVLMLLFLYLRKIRQKIKINLLLEKQKTEITAINEELESLNEELQVQNDLSKTQKDELERINAVKNKFFSIVSHDLRSPIATLKMLFNSYSSGHLTREEMDMLLKKMEDNIFSTADFLDNLLEWSKSQLEGMIVNPEAFPIKNLIDRNLKILNTQIVEKELIIENNIEESAISFADKNMTNVVVRNILSNSIKFCEQGDSIILNSKSNAESVLISIKDTGIGIHPDEQKKIFQLEHTISQGTSGEKGHHIGLVLCKDMVEQNKGKIWFESVFGEGTTFFIEIPLAVS
jgi:signal transduction histidine kinase